MRRHALSEATSTALGSTGASTTLGGIGFVTALLALATDETAALIGSAALLLLFSAIVVYVLHVNAAFDGPYHVLSSRTTWDLRDRHGSAAEAIKEQKVRFNYKTPVVQDTATSDAPAADPFAEYEAEHGELLGVTRRGEEFHAVIALRVPAQRGDEMTLVSRRTVRDQFPRDRGEWIEIIQSQKGHTELVVLFPPEHSPSNLRLWHSKTDTTRNVGDDATKEGGRVAFRLATRRMRAGERYRLEWDWVSRSRVG